MASPQLEDGYTRFANELLEALARTKLTGREFRVVMAVARLTYGFNKKSDAISHGQISKMTGIPRVKVVKLINGLVPRRVLGSAPQGTRQPSTIGINKNYEEWMPSPLQGTTPTPSPLQGTKPSPLQGTKPSPLQGTLQRKKQSSKEKYLTSSEVPDDRCPHHEILDLYHNLCPSLPAVKDWTPHRQSLLRSRWKESANRRNLGFWREFFASVSESDFLMGRAKEWRADLEWLIRPRNFVKVLEGRYANGSVSNGSKSACAQIDEWAAEMERKSDAVQGAL